MKSVMIALLLLICKASTAQQNNELPVPKLFFDSAGELIISPSSTSSKNDFDFFIGKWNLKNRILKKNENNSVTWNEFEATQEMHVILNGLGNIDNYLAERNGKPFEGMTLRLFNPQTKLWSIYWADSNYGTLGLPPVIGSFENKVGHFFSKDLSDGKVLITVYRWDARDVDQPVWSQATSEDYGNTWEWNWFMYMRR
ncbi:hypothetical protein [Dyadobacter arcticus]|uniref:DUF1579 domain-containing protein n=1 Tax=Dyadobacter arcticus TaxID=1078754 RepID=A0ABX0ULN3_9BACT|nr:hypothetical protein [Dyadobacter arcticus]NIJ52994.1 hypothetical protein [Dyadobacter arcticus]